MKERKIQQKALSVWSLMHGKQKRGCKISSRPQFQPNDKRDYWETKVPISLAINTLDGYGYTFLVLKYSTVKVPHERKSAKAWHVISMHLLQIG